MTTFLMLWALIDIGERYPFQTVVVTIAVLWIIISVVTIITMADKARAKDSYAVYRMKWVRIVAFLFPLAFWLALGVYCFVVDFILDETKPRS